MDDEVIFFKINKNEINKYDNCIVLNFPFFLINNKSDIIVGKIDNEISLNSLKESLEKHNIIKIKIPKEDIEKQMIIPFSFDSREKKQC